MTRDPLTEQLAVLRSPVRCLDMFLREGWECARIWAAMEEAAHAFRWPGGAAPAIGRAVAQLECVRHTFGAGQGGDALARFADYSMPLIQAAEKDEWE